MFREVGSTPSDDLSTGWPNMTLADAAGDPRNVLGIISDFYIPPGDPSFASIYRPLGIDRSNTDARPRVALLKGIHGPAYVSPTGSASPVAMFFAALIALKGDTLPDGSMASVDGPGAALPPEIKADILGKIAASDAASLSLANALDAAYQMAGAPAIPQPLVADINAAWLQPSTVPGRVILNAGEMPALPSL